ncbi:MAG: SMC-Scp complex subunit ScpB [Deltaproteobacteria bacterium]|nr:SMC-Scp complex subunit ScpB [Deltaproteobacteria bacterium]
MEHTELKGIVEALIFVSAEPLTVGAMALVLGEAGVEKAAIQQALDALVEEYQMPTGRGICLRAVAGGYQFRTNPECAPWLQRLNMPKPVRLSQAALETLAIVAYQQPMTRPEVEEIRGVDCGGVLKTLLERNLVRIVGKREEPGTPLLYGTTREFLSLFNLEGLSALPSLREYHELEQQTTIGNAAAMEAPAAEADQPIRPLDVETQVAYARADQSVIDELESQIRSLRHLERQMFPKPPGQEESDGTDEIVDVATAGGPPVSRDDVVSSS